MLRQLGRPFARSRQPLWQHPLVMRCTPTSGGPLLPLVWVAASTTSPSLTTTHASHDLSCCALRMKPSKRTKPLQPGHQLSTVQRSNALGRTVGGSTLVTISRTSSSPKALNDASQPMTHHNTTELQSR